MRDAAHPGTTVSTKLRKWFAREEGEGIEGGAQRRGAEVRSEGEMEEPAGARRRRKLVVQPSPAKLHKNQTPRLLTQSVQTDSTTEGRRSGTTHAASPLQTMRFFAKRPSAGSIPVASLPRSSGGEPSKSRPFTPQLPPELWVLIFYHASSPAHPFLASPHLSPSEYHASPDPEAPLSFMHFPHTHMHLLKQYRAAMRTKARLTLVCRLWHSMAQEVLYEFVWISRGSEARALCRVLKGLGRVERRQGVSDDDGDDDHEEEEDSKGKKKVVPAIHPPTNLVTRRRPDHAHSEGTYTYPYDTRNPGRHIRRLHIEIAVSPHTRTAASFDRCSPEDLLGILERAPLLQVYSDYGGIRRSCGWRIFGAGDSTTTISAAASPSSLNGASSRSVSILDGDGEGDAEGEQVEEEGLDVGEAPPRQQDSDLHILSTLVAHPARSTMLKRLSWVNYEYEAGDYDAGVRFYLRVVGPKLRKARDGLEFLELKLCAKDLRGMTGAGGTGGGWFESLITGNAGTTTTEVLTNGLNAPMNAQNLTTLSANLTSSIVTTTTTTTTTSSLSSFSTNASARLKQTLSSSTLKSLSSASPLVLPALRSLKVTLDNATFHVLSTWDMPALRNLSVISADFSYAGEGFAGFFEVHGGKIRQLELGHSTGAIEEYWLTAPPPPPPLPHGNSATSATAAAAAGWTFGRTRVPLAEWCPNLKEFICSADAEWNWQSPDWIAPHVLLPAHPRLQVIGVRDVEKRILEALATVEYRDLEAVREGRGIVVDEEGEGVFGEDEAAAAGGGGTDDPFFALQQQIGSLLRMEAFPALRYVRDLSFGSEIMRRCGRVRLKNVRAGGRSTEADLVIEDTEGDCGFDAGEEEEGGRRSGGTVAAAASACPPRPSSSSPSSPARMAHTLRAGTGPFGGFLASLMMGGGASTSSSSSSSAGAASRAFSATQIRQAEAARKLKLGHERQQGLRVVRFWIGVLRMCRKRGVWLEDWEGGAVTVEGLRRAVVGGTGDGVVGR